VGLFTRCTEARRASSEGRGRGNKLIPALGLPRGCEGKSL
jgi:hypothetical protein